MDTDPFDPLRRAPSADIAGGARRIGYYVWMTSRLFEISGQSAREAPHPATARNLAGVSSRMAWQAAEWHRRLPHLREVEVDTLIVAPSEQMVERFARIGRASAGNVTTELVGLLRELKDVYAAHIEVASPVTDGPVIRSLQRVSADTALAIGELEPAPGTSDDS